MAETASLISDAQWPWEKKQKGLLFLVGRVEREPFPPPQKKVQQKGAEQMEVPDAPKQLHSPWELPAIKKPPLHGPEAPRG